MSESDFQNIPHMRLKTIRELNDVLELITS
jgi:hypothetical protein